MADLLPSIETNAAAPRSAMQDGGSATQHSLPDQIAADKYIKSSQAAARGGLPIRQVKLRPPGAAGVELHDGRCP